MARAVAEAPALVERVSPFVLEEVAGEGLRLRLVTPLILMPELVGGLVELQHAELGIIAYGATQSEAEQAFREEVLWLWRTYAVADDADLTADARQLKRVLLRLLRAEGA
jgi:hypothetical protein